MLQYKKDFLWSPKKDSCGVLVSTSLKTDRRGDNLLKDTNKQPVACQLAIAVETWKLRREKRRTKFALLVHFPCLNLLILILFHFTFVVTMNILGSVLSILGLDGVHPANKKLKKELQALASLPSNTRQNRSESVARMALTELRASLDDEDHIVFKKYVIQMMEIIIDAGCGGDMMKGKAFKEVLNDVFRTDRLRITCETVFDGKGKKMDHHQITTKTKRAGVVSERKENIVFVWEIPDVRKLFKLFFAFQSCVISAVCPVHEPIVCQVQRILWEVTY